MKKYFTILVLVFIGFSTNAQTYKISYERKPNIEYQLRNETRPDVRARVAAYLSNNVENFLLIHSGTNSHYFKSTKDMLGLYEDKSVRNISGTYKNFKKDTLLKQSLMHEKLYLIKDRLPKIKWTETGEIKTILGYECRQIIAEYENKKLSAWYTDEIPIIDGPDLYYSDKGTILEIDIQSQIIKATSIEKLEYLTSIAKPVKGARVTLEEYRKRLVELKRNLTFND